MNEEMLNVFNELLAEIKDTKNEIKKMNTNMKQIHKQLKAMHKDANKTKETVEDGLASLNRKARFVTEALTDAMDGMLEYYEWEEDWTNDDFLPLFDEDFKL